MHCFSVTYAQLALCHPLLYPSQCNAIATKCALWAVPALAWQLVKQHCLLRALAGVLHLLLPPSRLHPQTDWLVLTHLLSVQKQRQPPLDLIRIETSGRSSYNLTTEITREASQPLREHLCQNRTQPDFVRPTKPFSGLVTAARWFSNWGSHNSAVSVMVTLSSPYHLPGESDWSRGPPQSLRVSANAAADAVAGRCWCQCG